MYVWMYECMHEGNVIFIMELVTLPDKVCMCARAYVCMYGCMCMHEGHVIFIMELVTPSDRERMCISPCMNVYICMYVWMYVHARRPSLLSLPLFLVWCAGVHICEYMYILFCMHVFVSAFIMHVRAYLFSMHVQNVYALYICEASLTDKSTYIHTRPHTYMHMHTCTHPHTYIHIYIHTHT